ncbi:hypothetical protein Micbo1qcDRAFT_4299 [Microdochium bolleyi]|uniref:Uncharacterized protein n=1 Tax=Microdochium bolleyi TaxID=196109 RepID=A0A136JIG6_9PEZI|nr:hypothetical protein Micbo1qcDRAFT_4299 [Microdochium bolleyi]
MPTVVLKSPQRFPTVISSGRDYFECSSPANPALPAWFSFLSLPIIAVYIREGLTAVRCRSCILLCRRGMFARSPQRRYLDIELRPSNKGSLAFPTSAKRLKVTDCFRAHAPPSTNTAVVCSQESGRATGVSLLSSSEIAHEVALSAQSKPGKLSCTFL